MVLKYLFYNIKMKFHFRLWMLGLFVHAVRHNWVIPNQPPNFLYYFHYAILHFLRVSSSTIPTTPPHPSPLTIQKNKRHTNPSPPCHANPKSDPTKPPTLNKLPIATKQASRMSLLSEFFIRSKSFRFNENRHSNCFLIFDNCVS